MTKPDGIPQDIWDAAGNCVKRLRLPELLDADFASRDEMDRLTLEIVGEDGLTIAHAILAEREACAQMAADSFVVPHQGSHPDQINAANQRARKIAATIRNRGTAA